jgi:hypothetical protein
MMIVGSLLTISLSACGKTVESIAPAPKFTVPHETLLVMDEVQSTVKVGDHAKVAYQKEKAARIEANQRLRLSRRNVRDVRLKAEAQ